MAREVAAILGLPLTDPAKLELLPGGDAAIKVRIEDLALCPRYSAMVFENVKVEPSPLWLQYRLTSIGLNPINNIVDMTNFVMAELAQPMHAFDADLLKGDTIFVRPAKAGEQFRALNDEEYTLAPGNLVIAVASGAIALAGVIGGKDSAIGATTTRIVLESANFQARRCARHRPRSNCGRTLRCVSKRPRIRRTRCAGWRGRSNCCARFVRRRGWRAGWRTTSGRRRCE